MNRSRVWSVTGEERLDREAPCLQVSGVPSGADSEGAGSVYGEDASGSGIAKGLMMATVKVTDASFEQDVLQSSEPVVVDFWAEWCGPCRQIGPALEEIATDLQGKVKIAKVNVDENPDLARQFDIMSIPTLIVFQDGQPVHRFQGASGKAGLLEQLSEFISVCAGTEEVLWFADRMRRRSSSRFAALAHVRESDDELGAVVTKPFAFAYHRFGERLGQRAWLERAFLPRHR